MSSCGESARRIRAILKNAARGDLSRKCQLRHRNAAADTSAALGDAVPTSHAAQSALSTRIPGNAEARNLRNPMTAIYLLRPGAGCRSGSLQDSSIPGAGRPPGFDIVYGISTLHQ